MADTLAQVYDWMAPVYYWVFGLSLEGARKKALKMAAVNSNDTVLEIGVGTGLTFRHLPDGVTFTGIDLSEKMLAQAQKRAKEQNKDYTLLKMDASNLSFPDESFDLVISAHFLSATSNPVLALSEMKRVTKKTGRILLVNNFQRTETMHFFEPVAKKMGFSLRLNLNELCLKTGLKVQHRKKVSRLLPIDAVTLIH
ncbi:MAG: class I SAM-dependent methyltransferase [Bdellovibrionota bacterium]